MTDTTKIIAEIQAGLNERELRELSFALTYRDHFNHGTDGHNRLILVAKLYEMLLRSREHEDRV